MRIIYNYFPLPVNWKQKENFKFEWQVLAYFVNLTVWGHGSNLQKEDKKNTNLKLFQP